MQQHTTDSHLEKILGQLQPFGFRFQGYDENKRPLVVAPNGQVVDINVAISFANEQITAQQENTPGSPEMPPEMPDGSIDTTQEQAPEVETQETPRIKESSEQISAMQKRPDPLQVDDKSPAMQLKPPKKIAPYGEGFAVNAFDPTNISQVRAFVQKNEKKKANSSAKWLAVLFKKFLEENNLDSE